MEQPQSEETMTAMQMMEELLVQLMQHKEAGPFLEPVDWKELELFDYPVIVKHPMDLGTVQRKLERKEYINAAACAYDMRLIWTNCMTYNTEGSEFWLLGKSFKRRFEDKYRRIKNDYEVGEDPEHLEDSTLAIDAAPEEYNDDPPDDEEEVEVTDANSDDTLADQLMRLTQSQLGKIVQRVQRECPLALKFPLPELLELETENLSTDIVEQIAELSSRVPKIKKRGPTIRYVNTTKRYKKKD